MIFIGNKGNQNNSAKSIMIFYSLLAMAFQRRVLDMNVNKVLTDIPINVTASLLVNCFMVPHLLMQCGPAGAG